MWEVQEMYSNAETGRLSPINPNATAATPVETPKLKDTKPSFQIPEVSKSDSSGVDRQPDTDGLDLKTRANSDQDSAPFITTDRGTILSLSNMKLVIKEMSISKLKNSNEDPSFEREPLSRYEVIYELVNGDTITPFREKIISGEELSKKEQKVAETVGQLDPGRRGLEIAQSS